jgi:hypothetical protein
MGWMLLSVAWLALACTVLGLGIYRKMMAYSEDDNLHLRPVDGPRIEQQKSLAGRVEFVDRWGKILTVVTLVCGILLAAAFLYQQWVTSYQLVP